MLVRVALIVIVLVAVGWLLPRLLVDDGLARYADDPGAAAFAAEALSVARASQDNPVSRLVKPAARVVQVRHDPDHCSEGEPGAAEPMASYRGTVRFYTLYALPAGSVYIDCGGWKWSRKPEAQWLEGAE